MRPYVIVSVAMSWDAHIDDASGDRLMLSGDVDLDLVDELRASCDAILVGAGTVRADNPTLQVRSAARRDARERSGRPGTPLRVVLSSSGDLDPSARVFSPSPGPRPLVLVTSSVDIASVRLTGVADVVLVGAHGNAGAVLDELTRRDVGRLLVEGGTSLNSAFLSSGTVDELRLAVAPFLVGDSSAPRLVADATYPFDATHRARLIDVSAAGDVAVLRYALSQRAA